MLFKAKDYIGTRYTVVFPIKKGAYAETYRVRSADGRRFFCKVIDPELLAPEQFAADGSIREISILGKLRHPNLPNFVETFPIHHQGRDYQVMIHEFISSETLADRLFRAQMLSVYDTKEIALGILDALQYLHSQSDPVIHNEVSALNILVDLSNDNLRTVRLIDFGSATPLSASTGISIDGLNWFYLAPERFDGVALPQSDLYAVGALIYQLTFGMLPWFCEISAIAPDRRKQHILNLKNSPLQIPNTSKFELEENLLRVMAKALNPDPDARFSSAEEFSMALRGKIRVDGEYQIPASSPDPAPSGATSGHAAAEGQTAPFSTPKGNGFKDVAGMESLKQMLQTKVLNILRDTEKARRYRLQIPNGILFYGPPGCGKTFMAEKFAEEAGYNFKLVKSSDLASIYVHGAQEKIGQLFDEARKNAPTILCFDEFDALVPERGRQGAEHQAGEVNEFLSQLNNCGETGVFIIATTNRPDMIDSAVLRRGRIDKIIYIPEPDADSRAAMFELHMQGRPYDSGIDYARLAELTQNYVASDIAYVVNEAAARAAFSDAKISMAHLEEVIAECKPSLSPAVMADFRRIREKMEGIVDERRRVGF